MAMSPRWCYDRRHVDTGGVVGGGGVAPEEGEHLFAMVRG